MKDISIQLKNQFKRLYQIAFSDHNFSKEELFFLYDFGKKRGISKEDLEKIIMEPTEYSTFPEDLDEQIRCLYELALMIWADGIVTDNEKNTLKKYIRLFGFQQENTEKISNFLLEHAQEKKAVEEVVTLIKNG